MVTKQQKLAFSGLLNHPSLLKMWKETTTHYITSSLTFSALWCRQGSWLCHSQMIIVYIITSDCSECLEHARQIENFHHHFPKYLQINWWQLSNSWVALKTCNSHAENLKSFVSSQSNFWSHDPQVTAALNIQKYQPEDAQGSCEVMHTRKNYVEYFVII